jgi:rod shape-determining protein MreD
VLTQSIRDPWPLNPYLTFMLLLVLVLVQTTVMPSARLGYVSPSLPLLAVVTWVMLRGPYAGAWWAVIAGLCMDWVSPAPFGLYTLPMLVTAFLVSLLRTRLFANTNVLLPALVAALATLVFSVTQRALMGAVGVPVVWRTPLLIEETVPAILLSLIWLPIVYFPLRAISRSLVRSGIEWER